jgi:hypothetical protein
MGCNRLKKCCQAKPRCSPVDCRDAAETQERNSNFNQCSGKKCTKHECCINRPTEKPDEFCQPSVCPSAFRLQRNAFTDACQGHCTASQCCETMPAVVEACTPQHCPALLNLRRSPFNGPCVAPDGSGKCDIMQCCEHIPEDPAGPEHCAPEHCPAALNLQRNAFTGECKAPSGKAECTITQCCEVAKVTPPPPAITNCGEYTCPAPTVRRYNAKQKKCSAQTCNDDYCCWGRFTDSGVGYYKYSCIHI